MNCIVEEIDEMRKRPAVTNRWPHPAITEQNSFVQDNADASPNASIVVARVSPRDVQQRQLIVSIDGLKVATLMFGDRVTRVVPPGPHRIRVHNTLVWKTIDVELAPGEQAHFSAVNRATWGTYAMLSTLGTGPLYVELSRESENPRT